MRKLRSFEWIIAGLFLCAAFGQNRTAQISGVVQDPSGSAVPQARVAVRNVEQQDEIISVGNRGHAASPSAVAESSFLGLNRSLRWW